MLKNKNYLEIGERRFIFKVEAKSLKEILQSSKESTHPDETNQENFEEVQKSDNRGEKPTEDTFEKSKEALGILMKKENVKKLTKEQLKKLKTEIDKISKIDVDTALETSEINKISKEIDKLYSPVEEEEEEEEEANPDVNLKGIGLSLDKLKREEKDSWMDTKIDRNSNEYKNAQIFFKNLIKKNIKGAREKFKEQIEKADDALEKSGISIDEQLFQNALVEKFVQKAKKENNADPYIEEIEFDDLAEASGNFDQNKLNPYDSFKMWQNGSWHLEDVIEEIQEKIEVEIKKIKDLLTNKDLGDYAKKLPQYIKQIGEVRGIELIKDNKIQPAFIFDYLLKGGDLIDDIKKISLAEKWKTAPEGEKNLEQKIDDFAKSFGLKIEQSQKKEFLQILAKKNPAELSEFKKNTDKLIQLSASFSGYLSSNPEEKRKVLSVLDKNLIKGQNLNLVHLTSSEVLTTLQKNLQTFENIKQESNTLIENILGKSAGKIKEFGEKFGISIETNNLADQLGPLVLNLFEGKNVNFATIFEKKGVILNQLKIINTNFNDSNKTKEIKAAFGVIKQITGSELNLSKIQENITSLVDNLLKDAKNGIDSFIAEKLHLKREKDGTLSAENQKTVDRFRTKLAPKALSLFGKYLKQEKGVNTELIKNGNKLNIGALVEYAANAEGVNLKKIINEKEGAPIKKIREVLGKDMKEFIAWSMDSDDAEVAKIRSEIIDTSLDAWAGNDFFKGMLVGLLKMLRGMFKGVGKMFGPILKPVYKMIEEQIPEDYRSGTRMIARELFGSEVTRQPANTEKAENNLLGIIENPTTIEMDTNTLFYLKEGWGDIEEKVTDAKNASSVIKKYYAIQLKEIFGDSKNKRIKELAENNNNAIKHLDTIIESLYKTNKVEEKLTDKKLNDDNGEIIINNVIIGKGGEIIAENTVLMNKMAEDYANFMPAWKTSYENLQKEDKGVLMNTMNLIIQNSDYESLPSFISTIVAQKVTGKSESKTAAELADTFKQNKLTRMMYRHLYEWKETQKDKQGKVKEWGDLLKENPKEILSKLKTLGFDWDKFMNEILKFFGKK